MPIMRWRAARPAISHRSAISTKPRWQICRPGWPRRNWRRRWRNTAAARATAAFDAAFAPPPKRPVGLRYVDYGSDLRDSAAVLAFAAGNRDAEPRLTV